ncbi:MAG: multicopper oxidase domain-containing protein, partial [Steroidobacteraceae bacterium]
MNYSTTAIAVGQKVLGYTVALIGSLALAGTAQAAVHGITGITGTTGTTFNLTARDGSISQPDGAHIYAWGYGCTVGSTPAFLPAQDATTGSCPEMQLPGPTLIVTQGQSVTVTLTNNLPSGAGATSIIFPGMAVTATGGSAGILTREAATNSGTVTYQFNAGNPGTYAYYSGTQSNLQVEMGLSGAIVVLPSSSNATGSCKAKGTYSLANAAYDQKDSCYDREYLFQFSELSSNVHDQVKAQVDACPVGPCAQIAATLEPYRPNYFMVNGRSMPDDMEVAYSPSFPNQPYNGNPHMHPGENVLMRVIGQGRWQHPFHFHGNHARVLARDASMLLSQTNAANLAGPLLFTIATVPGQTVDAIFNWTGQGLNWDVYGTQPHTC